jgi:hypothetical protein
MASMQHLCSSNTAAVYSAALQLFCVSFSTAIQQPSNSFRADIQQL